VVEEVGAGVSGLARGDLVIAPFTFCDGTCPHCLAGVSSQCMAGGSFGNHGIDGGQGEAVRVPLAGSTLVRVPGRDHSDETMRSLVALSDVMCTGHHAAVSAGVKPGEKLSIGYQTAQPARMVLFAVDEGILQVAHYKTPDPLAHFFQKRSLDVSTRQILDLILPEFRAAMLSAPGGDQRSLLGANLNPFKRKTDRPVAWWSGVIEAGDQPRTLDWTVPDYFNGSLRIMAVAVNDTSIGVAEQVAVVRGDLILSPNAPLTVAPGDEFEVSVGVANNVVGSGADAAVMVKLESSEQFEVLGPALATVKIAEMRESSTRFRLRTRDVLGSGTLRFSARLGTKGGALATTVSVRPATAYLTSLLAGSFTGL